MKNTKLFAFILCFVGAQTLAYPQSLPPPSLVNQCLYTANDNFEVPSSLLPGAVYWAFGANGAFYWVNPDGSLAGGPYQYTYTVNSSTQATITETFPIGVYLNGTTLTVVLSFTDGITGRVAATASSGASIYSGNFRLSPFGGAAPLVNLSSRGILSSGQTQVAGFVVSGSVPRVVLIRAIGPTLSQFGVTSPIQQTTVSVFRGSSVVATNAGWSSGGQNSTTQLTQAFAAVGAFSLPVGSADSALIVTLNPGVYTAVAQGLAASDSGAILVETYFVQ